MKTFEVLSNNEDTLEKAEMGQYWKENDKRFYIKFEGDDIEVRDEYHSMHELYQHRMALNIALFNTLDSSSDYHSYRVYKSEHHHPDSDKMFEGYFIVWCIDVNGKWTSYHYHLKHWEKFNIPTAVFSPLFPNNHVLAIEFFGKMFGLPE
jgi:hypothetical protein